MPAAISAGNQSSSARSATLTDVTINASNAVGFEAQNGTADLNSCTITQTGGNSYGSTAIASSGGSTININGGTIANGIVNGNITADTLTVDPGVTINGNMTTTTGNGRIGSGSTLNGSLTTEGGAFVYGVVIGDVAVNGNNINSNGGFNSGTIIYGDLTYKGTGK